MGFLYRLLAVILIGVFTVTMIACPKSVETSEEGPGGLPKQIVEEGTPPVEDVDYPIYPGAVKKSAGVYITGDNINQVSDYYVNKFGFEPVTHDEHGEALTFETESYELVLLPLPVDSGGGTQIKFSSHNESN